MLQEGAYITDGQLLLRVESAKWLGKHPNRRLVVVAENCWLTSEHPTLNEKKMQRFRYVEPLVEDSDSCAPDLPSPVVA